MKATHALILTSLFSFGLMAVSGCDRDKEAVTPPASGSGQAQSPAATQPVAPNIGESQTDEFAAVEDSADEGAADEEIMHGAIPDDDAPVEEAPVLYIVSPEHGDEVSNPVIVVFGLEGMQVAPAGTYEPNTGHHHLLIDLADLPPLDQPIPADENHIHFGKGQTETELNLPPGEHTLQLLLGDGNHIPHDPPVVSEMISITVVE